jgi:hypothetical protein
LVVSNELTLVVTNQFGIPFVNVNDLPYGNDISYPSWGGWNLRRFDTNSFQVPLMVSQTFTNGIYLRQSPFVVPLAPPRWDAITIPRIWMGLQFRLHYFLIDTSVNRIVDFVNIVDTQQRVDITAELAQGATGVISLNLSEQWATNAYRFGALVGIMNQIFASEGQGGTISDWRDTYPPSIAGQEQTFRNRLNNGGTNSFLAPYSPARTVWQHISLQANDPLVHYMGTDLTSTNGALAAHNRVDLTPATPVLANLGNVNAAYQPWGGNSVGGGSSINPNPEFDVNYQVKDPMIYQSDNWNFPTGEALSFEWLGRVHRGTPWQTVYLKPPNLSISEWAQWDNDNVVPTNGNVIFVDAGFSHPINDWNFASLWARWLNTNDLSTLLSINSTDTNAWAARLDGLTALTNSAVGELDPTTISSNSPQAGIIAQAIQAARANTDPMNGAVFPNHVFQDIGDVLATPQLSVASPFLNTASMNSVGAGGITDEALEKIPTQLLPLLRADSFGKIVPANGQLEMSFSGYDDHAYAIEASSNFIDWIAISTNCPSDGNFGITIPATSGQQFYRSVLLH